MTLRFLLYPVLFVAGAAWAVLFWRLRRRGAFLSLAAALGAAVPPSMSPTSAATAPNRVRTHMPTGTASEVPRRYRVYSLGNSRESGVRAADRTRRRVPR